MSLSKIPYLLLSTGSNQEDKKSSQHDWKIVDWDVKHQNKQCKTFLESNPFQSRLGHVGQDPTVSVQIA